MNKCKFLICFLGLLITSKAFGQEDKFKAIYIYQFTKFIEWPTLNNNPFQIAILGETPLLEELKVIASKKKIGSADIQVKKINTLNEIGNAQICYISASKKKIIPEAVTALKNKNILVITDNANTCLGINFVEVNQKLTFQVSRNKIESYGLKLSNELLSLGIAVN